MKTFYSILPIVDGFQVVKHKLLGQWYSVNNKIGTPKYCWSAYIVERFDYIEQAIAFLNGVRYADKNFNTSISHPTFCGSEGGPGNHPLASIKDHGPLLFSMNEKGIIDL